MAPVDQRGSLLIAHARKNAWRDLDDRSLDAELRGGGGDFKADQTTADYQ